MVKEATSSSIKKKRKTTNPEPEPDSDIYKKVINFEEKEAFNSQGSVEGSLYSQLCLDIRCLIVELVTVKIQDQISKFLKEIQRCVFIKMCFIKKLNRTEKLRHVNGKETLSTEKQKCDSIKLNYQNLVYELDHLVTETNKCRAFKSQDEDIELVPFEEFLKEAPETLTTKFLSYDANDIQQKHSLRLVRLEWELTQCKSLAQLCKSLLEEQKKLSQDIIVRKEKLNVIDPLLLVIINATRPLQEHLNISSNEVRNEPNCAQLLPIPLYIFYVNVASYKVVWEYTLDVEIVGDEEEAVQWNETKMANGANDDESDAAEAEQDTAEAEEVVEVKKRRHRKSVQQVDPMEEKRKKLLESHPLKVQITVKLKDEPSLTVNFAYQTRLNIVTVTSSTNTSKITGNSARDVLRGENLLSELIEGDNGLESPNPVTKYQMKKVGLGSFQSVIPQIGYAYHWAQRVCGKDFLSRQMNSAAISCTSVENIMGIMVKRLQTRFRLALQLQQLEQNMLVKLPKSVDCPVSSTCSISKWTAISFQKYCELDFTRTFVVEEIVSASDLFYSVQITRGIAYLEAYIVIKSTYPNTLPIISVCINYNGPEHSGSSDEIRDIERMLNVNWDNTHPASILSIQIARLCSYFDVYLETTYPKAFPQTVTLIRSISARNRRRPLKYRNIGNGMFTQY